MKVRNFYIIINKTKDKEHSMTNQIKTYLLDHGMKCSCQDYNRQRVHSGNYSYTDAALVPEDTECIIVLGGDGTLIQASRDLIHKNIPLLGVNIGTLGFLTDSDMDSVYETLDRIMMGNYEIDSRMMLEGSIIRDGKEIYHNIALNDIVINRCGMLRVIDFDVTVNQEYLNSYSADGVIISTATGSTAYSLSAGGPIIQPNAQLLMVTPICPHTLNKRSIIFGADDEITIIMNDNKGLEEERNASFDGEQFCKVITGDRIIVKKSPLVAKFIKTNKLSFLQRIRNKM